MIGGGTPAGSDEQLVSADTILAETQSEIFSKRQIAFAFARRRRDRRLIPSYGTAPRCGRMQPIVTRRGRMPAWNHVIHIMSYDFAVVLLQAATEEGSVMKTSIGSG
jgi:hypothetical protein